MNSREHRSALHSLLEHLQYFSVYDNTYVSVSSAAERQQPFPCEYLTSKSARELVNVRLSNILTAAVCQADPVMSQHLQ